MTSEVKKMSYCASTAKQEIIVIDLSSDDEDSFATANCSVNQIKTLEQRLAGVEKCALMNCKAIDSLKDEHRNASLEMKQNAVNAEKSKIIVFNSPI